MADDNVLGNAGPQERDSKKSCGIQYPVELSLTLSHVPLRWCWWLPRLVLLQKQSHVLLWKQVHRLLICQLKHVRLLWEH